MEAQDELPRPALRRRGVPPALQVDGPLHRARVLHAGRAPLPASSRRPGRLSRRGAAQHHLRHPARHDEGRHPRRAGQGGRGEPPLVQRLRRSGASRHEGHLEHARRLPASLGRRAHAARDQAPGDPVRSGAEEAPADLAPRGRLARRGRHARDARRRAQRCRRGAGAGSLLPPGRARRARARLHGADRQRDARAAPFAKLRRGGPARGGGRRARMGELPARHARLGKGRRRCPRRAAHGLRNERPHRRAEAPRPRAGP